MFDFISLKTEKISLGGTRKEFHLCGMLNCDSVPRGSRLWERMLGENFFLALIWKSFNGWINWLGNCFLIVTIGILQVILGFMDKPNWVRFVIEWFFWGECFIEFWFVVLIWKMRIRMSLLEGEKFPAYLKIAWKWIFNGNLHVWSPFFSHKQNSFSHSPYSYTSFVNATFQHQKLKNLFRTTAKSNKSSLSALNKY